MASTKSTTKMNGTTGLQRFTNGAQWSAGPSQRLARARSSPNVSKQLSIPTVITRQSGKHDESRTNSNVSSVKKQVSTGSNRYATNIGKSSLSSRGTGGTTKSVVGNVTVVQIPGLDCNSSPAAVTTTTTTMRSSVANGKSRQPFDSSSRFGKAGTPGSAIARSEVKRKSDKRLKETSSCTILEDRALLKKGLSCAPERLPRKPEAMCKKSLNRSTSLWSVPADSEIGRVGQIRGDGKKEEVREERSSLNRATSLWNVPSDGSGRLARTRSVSGLRPSRIPLFTQHFTSQFVAQSLADLSQVDRAGEKNLRRIVDLDEVDRSIDEHIYENCRETTEKSVNQDREDQTVVVGPIYENLKNREVERSIIEVALLENERQKIGGKREIARAKSVPVEVHATINLEKRVEQLMAELDEDDDDDQKPTRPSKIDLNTCRENMTKSRELLSKSRENLHRSREELARSKESLTRGQETLKKSRGFTKSHESLLRRGESEMSIQEIRRNWENQIKRSQEKKVPPRGKLLVPSPKLKSNTNGIAKKPPLATTSLVPPLSDKYRDKTKTMSTTMTTTTSGKRAKEIEHLVNFFNNCKNNEATTGPSAKDVARLRDVNGMKECKSEKDKEEKSSGYVSDGNCSEDSGHMSNENETEWKERQDELKSLNKSEEFLKEIIHDLDSSLERTIEVFASTPIVRRFIPAEEKKMAEKSLSTSSGASSIDDSWEDTTKTTRGNADGERWKNERVPKTKLTMVPSTSVMADTSNRQQVTIKTTRYRTQIFFRSGTLERLESQRDEKLTGHIVLLQARCRGYLARRRLNTLKLQDLAVRCIQRNVRKLMSVREWPWWRLYVKVAPLLNVHRTEDQLKARTEELEILRAKVDRLEQERNHLKHDNDKLEAKLSEMTVDFAEEHSTSTLAAERIDVETSERIRLERELQDVTEANKNLQQTTERLEMELLYARAADLNGVASDGEDAEDGGVYKQRYEHAIRELEFTKRKMAQQHEDDLEQLVGLKKQLEKKLADAYEEVEEQRQVVGQWKRRVQKLNGEMHDLRLLLEEQTARNNLLEKKQRKFDSETQNLMDDLRQEKVQRERLGREKEIVIAEKFTVEQNLSDARLEIELKEERLHALTQELEELTFGGKTEEEVAQLKKAKHELEKKTKDQEEELDDLAGQVQLLEQAKLRLEMSIEQQRKEMRKEMQQRDEELEDVRGNAHKKVKALESQLETEHEERTILLREKHELERRLVSFEEQDRTDRAADAETMQRLKRDLKRTRALLRDAQTMLERSKGDSSGKAALRQLKNQLEDAECARAAAVKAKQALELELNETQAALDEASRLRSEAEERANAASRERTELRSQLEENEEELAEVLKKYRAAVQQVSAEQAQLQEAQVQIATLEAERSSLKDQLSELSQRLESVEQLGDPTANSLATRRLEFRAKELESKLELEQTTRARLETQIARLKESVDKLQTETVLLRTKEQTAQDAARRLQRSLREARDEACSAVAREQEATRARRDLEKTLEAAEAETKIARDDLRLALQRIDDLQSAIQGELDLDCSEEATTDNSDSD